MGIFDMEDFRDPRVVEQERMERKQNSMLQRAVGSGLDIAHQMLQANEMALHISLRDAMNDENKKKADDYRAMREAAHSGTAKDEQYASDIRERAEKSAASYARTSLSEMDKGDGPQFY